MVPPMIKPFLVIFFFQAEDGIRDGRVTGVQTCLFRSRTALRLRGGCTCWFLLGNRRSQGLNQWERSHSGDGGARGQGARSEERRVGKECRAGRAAGRQRRKGYGLMGDGTAVPAGGTGG